MTQLNNAVAMGAPVVLLPQLSYDPTQPGGLQQHIRAAHAAASTALLGFLLRGGGPAGRPGGAGLVVVLRSIKHFFLLDQVGALGRNLFLQHLRTLPCMGILLGRSDHTHASFRCVVPSCVHVYDGDGTGQRQRYERAILRYVILRDAQLPASSCSPSRSTVPR